jgi:hypothetical protein
MFFVSQNVSIENIVITVLSLEMKNHLFLESILTTEFYVNGFESSLSEDELAFSSSESV